MSKFLFEVQQKNRLAQKGLLKRFSINCIGHQESVEEMRAEKALKFRELKEKKGTKEYDEWFLSYRPDGSTENPGRKNKTIKKSRTIRNSTTTKKNKTRTNKKNNSFFFYHVK